MLLVTCANVANLQLVRASARRRELGVRLALGASRARIMRQSLLESGLLSAVGGGLGLLLAAWGVDGVRALLPLGFSRAEEIALDLPVLGFAVALAALAGVAAGALPAWFASRQDPAGSLADGGARRGGRRRRAADALAARRGGDFPGPGAAGGAGLLGRSFVSLLRAKPGFRTERVLTLGLSLSDVRYPDTARKADFYRRALEAVRAVPGVENTALASTQFFNWTMSYNFLKLGRRRTTRRRGGNSRTTTPSTRKASPRWASRSCGAGRSTGAMSRAPPPVMVVNEEFVRPVFPPGWTRWARSSLSPAGPPR